MDPRPGIGIDPELASTPPPPPPKLNIPPPAFPPNNPPRFRPPPPPPPPPNRPPKLKPPPPPPVPEPPGANKFPNNLLNASLSKLATRSFTTSRNAPNFLASRSATASRPEYAVVSKLIFV